MKQNGKDLLKQPPEKVILMYQAVSAMINEGCDINNMKVIDITNRAGIGKGTAYEYFTSKEEIIMRALLYEMMGYLDTITQITYSEATFQEKMFQLLDFGTKHFNEGRTFFQILKIILGTFDISDALKEEFQQIQEENICTQFTEIMDAIMQAGVEEHVLKQENVMMHRLVFNSQMFAFCVLLHENAKNNANLESLDEIKQFIYDSVVKLLG